jgi:thiol-disulfide isomerase/thioredoxin
VGLLFTAPALAQQHESNPKALRALEAMVKAYRGRPALTVKTTVTVELLEGDVSSRGSEVKAEFILAKGRVGVIKLRGFTCYLGGGTLTAVHQTTEGHSYFSTPDDGSPYYVLMSAFVDIPFPHLAIAFGEEDTEELCMQFHQKAPWVLPTAVRTEVRDDQEIQRIKLTSDFETINVDVDPDTKLIQSIEAQVFAGPLVQPEATLIYRHSFTYETHDEPLDEAVLGFDPGERQPVDTLAALVDRRRRADEGRAAANLSLEGKAAPLFMLATADGGAIDLETLRGRVVVLDFWATWCGPCRHALPLLHEVADWAREQALPVTVLTVNSWEIRDPERNTPQARLAAVDAFWKRLGFTLPVAMDYTDETAPAYGVKLIPATFVIRADGIVYAQHAGAGPDYVQALKDEIMEAIELAPAGD